MRIEQVHEKILNLLMDYRKSHPDFTFQLRKKPPEKLSRGMWFTGNENYIFVGFYKVGCTLNMTKTIGFVWGEDKQYFEVVFRKIKNITENEQLFYNELIQYLKSLSFKDIKEKNHQKQYWFIFKSKDLEKNLLFVLNTIRPYINDLLKKYNLTDKYMSSNEEFNKMLEKIDAYKNNKIIKIQEKKIKMKTKNIILYGPPGVGKTHNYQRLISMIESGEDEKTIFDIIINSKSSEAEELNQEQYKNIENQKRVEFITFHQSYSYEDFIEGFRPTEDGNIKLEDGIFKTLAQKALENREQNYYIVIDEINRGNISKIFGELITLIEEDKRDIYAVTLPYSKEKFTIPSNLYIIATMNSTDKSIATIDIALRRRFIFLKMQPNANLVKNQEAKELMNRLNAFIQKRLGVEFLLGHSYFMDKDIDLEFVKEYKIRPLLEEYFYSDEDLDIDKLLSGEIDVT